MAVSLDSYRPIGDAMIGFTRNGLMYGNLYLLRATLDICTLSYLGYFSGGSGISGAEQIKLLKSVMGITQPGQFTMGIHLF